MSYNCPIFCPITTHFNFGDQKKLNQSCASLKNTYFLWGIWDIVIYLNIFKSMMFQQQRFCHFRTGQTYSRRALVEKILSLLVAHTHTHTHTRRSSHEATNKQHPFFYPIVGKGKTKVRHDLFCEVIQQQEWKERKVTAARLITRLR